MGTTGDTTTACSSISISSHDEQGRLRRAGRWGIPPSGEVDDV
jgi:hypothetical protein